MSQAVMRIQVDTLSDVPDGQGRNDGVPDKLVTVRSVGTGSTHELRFWDVANPGVAGAGFTTPSVPALTALGDGRTWTFTPPGGADAFGQTFGLELIVDRGLPTQDRSRHIYAIRTKNLALRLPLFGEGADPQASLLNRGALQIARSADNAGGNWRGFHPVLLEWIVAQDKYLDCICVAPYPQSFVSGDPTVPVHIGTTFLEKGTLLRIEGDFGDLADATKHTVLELRKQSSPSSVFASLTVQQLKVWAMGVVNVEIPTSEAYEVYIHSQEIDGQWAVKAVRLLAK